MVLAFPRLCAGAGYSEAPIQGGKFRQVAPSPHLRAPSGSFVVSSFPNNLLMYYPELGLREVSIVRHSPNEQAFDAGDIIIQYRIETADGRNLFECT